MDVNSASKHTDTEEAGSEVSAPLSQAEDLSVSSARVAYASQEAAQVSYPSPRSSPTALVIDLDAPGDLGNGASGREAPGPVVPGSTPVLSSISATTVNSRQSRAASDDLLVTSSRITNLQYENSANQSTATR